MHAKGKIVSVWLDSLAPVKEDEDFLERIYDLNVDIIMSDFPEKTNALLT